MSSVILRDGMTKKLTDEFRKYLASLGRKGGKARTQKMTPKERKELARKAAQARWAKAHSLNAPSKQHRDRNEREQ